MEWNGQWYLCILASCAFLTWAILKGLTRQKIVWCLCMVHFISCSWRNWFWGLIWESLYVYVYRWPYVIDRILKSSYYVTNCQMMGLVELTRSWCTSVSIQGMFLCHQQIRNEVETVFWLLLNVLCFAFSPFKFTLFGGPICNVESVVVVKVPSPSSPVSELHWWIWWCQVSWVELYARSPHFISSSFMVLYIQGNHTAHQGLGKNG